MRANKQRNYRNSMRGSRLCNCCCTFLKITDQERFGGFSVEDIDHHRCPSQLPPPESVVDARCGWIDSPQQKSLAAGGAKILHRLATQVRGNARPRNRGSVATSLIPARAGMVFECMVKQLPASRLPSLCK